MSGESSADGAESPVSTGDLLLGRYRVTERLAEGGHSVIFRVDDERLRRPACAKIFQLQGAAPEIQEAVERRFIHEAFLLARLAHPGTVQIYDFGYLAGPGGGEPGRTERPFQICELVNGGPLSRWVKRRGRLAPREVLATVVPLCRALADVHASRLVHLDVKPQNILLARTATGPMPKLADFGIAQAMDAPVPGGESSLLMYSVNWAAPEQMVGDPVDATSDVYSLSLVTIYALTGRLVFQDQDPASAYRMRKFSDEVLGNALDGSGLGDELVNFFLRACSFNPSNRLGDAAEYARQLQVALSPLLSLSTTPTPSPPDDSGPGAYPDQVGPDRSLPGRVAAASLWPLSLERPTPDIAGRRVEFKASVPAADLEADNGARIRVSFVPSSAERPSLHIKGVNCFVASSGRRPSSALTLDVDAPVQLLSPRGERLAGADVAFATAGPSKTVVALAGQSLVVPTDECANLVAIDFGPGRTCALVYERPRTRV
jgi:serine/threonine protein kinase